ncbi:MAG: hypothetical protein MUQ32_14380, partial [Chloroflexi bacterium]|nr:hypothetical protein [Chloroflexota bacterium]
TGEIIGFTGGYVARHQGPGVYFSPDGRAWQEVLLPSLDIEGARDPYIVALASSGARVLAVGGYGYDPCRSTDQGGGPACEMSPMAWVTDDGVTWRPSDPWALPPGVAEPEWGADASAAWAVPGGWEAARVSWEGAGQHPVDIWRSADGITWERVAALESPGINQGHGVAVAGDGTRVRWDSLHICPAEGICPVQSLLRTSADGATWTELGTFPGADVSITRVAPPIPGQRSTWVVAGTEIHFDEGGGIGSLTPRIWTSSDLSTWTAADLEVPDGARSGIIGLTWSQDRLVAVDGKGLTWVSPDGSSWTLLADRRAVGLIADGPIGIIGMPEPGWDGDEGIWLLSSPATAILPAPSEPAGPLPTPSASPTPLAESAVVVTCDGPTASVSAPAVRARPDGVHLEGVRNDNSPATFYVSTEEAGWIENAEGAAALVLAPGAYELTCVDLSEEEEPRAEVLVTDPDGLWKSGEIECEGGGGVTGSGSEPPASPEAAIAYLRSIVLNFRPDDVLEPAGYPDAPLGRIRLVRDGRLAAAWSVVGSGSSMGINRMDHCPGADIAYSED